MSVRRANGGDLQFELDALRVGWLTWLGLLLAAIGWGILLAEATVADILSSKAARPFGPTFHADLFDIAKCVILSGFGLAIVGALHAGFGTLNRFFAAVLMRSHERARPPAPHPPKAEVESPPPDAPVEGRPYRLLPDGSVEVETILGTRLFKSMAEARDFI